MAIIIVPETLHCKHDNNKDIALLTGERDINKDCTLLTGRYDSQGGISFWLRGNLRDLPGISPKIALIKNKNNGRKCI